LTTIDEGSKPARSSTLEGRLKVFDDEKVQML